MFKIGIVGAGIIGKGHSNAIFNNSDCELCAVCDLDINKAQEIAQKHGAAFYTDYKLMAEENEFDAVILNLPHYLHCEVSIYFLNRGINVLVEKPMAITSEECDKMIEAAKKNNVKLAVGHVQRYFSAIKETKEIIKSGKLGKLCMITEKRNVDYLPNRPAWFLKKELSGGGILMNYGAHSLDRIFYATGLSVNKIHSAISNPLSDDNIELNAQIFMEMSDGVTATISYCGCHVPREYETAFYFTNGAIKILNTELRVSEGKEFVSYGGEAKYLDEQLIEFVKLLKGEDSKIADGEYGKTIIEVIEKIV